MSLPQPGKPIKALLLAFKALGVGRPHDVELIPLHKLSDRRYTVYLDLFTAADFGTNT